MVVNRNKNLEKRLNNTTWAYTGSMALKIHGNNKGIPFYRNVGNINIAVKKNNHSFVIPLIASKEGKWILRSSPNIRNRHTKFISKNGSTTLNLLSNNLAPPMNKIVHVNGVPVMSINALYNQKRKMNNKKAKNNVNYLLKLDPSLKNKSPSPRRNSPSRARRRNFGSTARSLF